MHADAEIKFECSGCGAHLSADVAVAGQTTACPSCQEALVVPHLDLVTRVASITEHGHRENISTRQGRAYELLESESSALREQLIDGARARARMKRDLAAARMEIESLQGQLQGTTEECERLAGNLGELQSENEGLTRTRAELMVQQAELHQHSAILQVTLTEREETIAGLRLELKKGEEERETLNGELLPLREEVKQLRERVAEMDALQKEVSNLRKDLAMSSDALECNRQRERLEATEESLKLRDNDVEKLRGDMEQLSQAGEELRRELNVATERYKAAEQRAEELSEAKVQEENQVLRSILSRQKAELENCYQELKLLRRARFGVQLAYALFALGLLGIAVFAFQVLAPQVLPQIVDLL